VQATFGLVNAIADVHTPLPDGAVATELSALAWASLLAPSPAG
jgi:hypothetical protein